MSLDEEKVTITEMTQYPNINIDRQRYPFCIVWTPIPLLTWIFPFIGHMGICTSQGIIRDFAGPYFVSEDNMAFGNPTKYWQLDPEKVVGGAAAWDRAISEAADTYKGRMHNLCCDNCHSMVARALNNMHYEDSTSWNMVTLALLSWLRSSYVSFGAWLKTWLPFFFWASCVLVYVAVMKGVFH